MPARGDGSEVWLRLQQISQQLGQVGWRAILAILDRGEIEERNEATAGRGRKVIVRILPASSEPTVIPTPNGQVVTFAARLVEGK